ncbi:uncharacterized protein PADG_02295 [Paracoccidioides brasiliensis Pb18]|uniref:Transcription initiation factor TFIID subunit 13 n=1 Tax=Paracoccidioides brasiliensis (strain Pb18) TaxID=502780 RepID=C1G2C9_PARBD|nr:uncharacterized protein PADG_02295 [Paracoccidioides brasiliensis Pb18]EEH46145.2 hypothetical protein PADG_02295 [Paracoccidioides brasiliensis Pb18]
MYIHYGLEESKTSIPVLVAIHYPRHYRMGVSACADDEENDEEEGLEVEERSLLNISQCQPSEKKRHGSTSNSSDGTTKRLSDFHYFVKNAPHHQDYYELEQALNSADLADENTTNYLARRKVRQLTTGMAEPRVRLTRHQGQLNFGNELRHLLHAYGDPSPHPSYPQEPLPETLRVLDEIVTDFIIETCHSAAQCATYSRRQKIKVDDFRFALRRDPVKLGRVQELFRIERELKEARRAFDQNDDQVAASGKKGLEELAESVVEGGDGSSATAAGPKKGKGKASSVSVTGKRAVDTTSEGVVAKKRKSVAGGSVT